MKQAWYSIGWVKVLLHMTGWAIVFSLPYLLRSPYDNHHVQQDPDEVGFFYLNTITNILFAGVFYLNAYLLVPAFIYSKRYVLYFLLLTLIFCGVMGIHLILFSMLIKSKPFIFILSARFNLPTYLLTVAVSTAYQMIGDKIRDEKKENQKQEENLKTELSFLRSQISPHFMFNVLNNIVALARTKSELVESTVIKLSSLMRYMLYENNEEKATLKKEIEYLRSYIDLQVQRFEDSVTVNVSTEVSEDRYFLEPMLLIPFVENAFKHGIGMIEDPLIEIKLRTDKNILYFSVRNKYNRASRELRDSTKGIGLANVKRRLNLLYGKDQSLLISGENNWFIVSLQLKLH